MALTRAGSNNLGIGRREPITHSAIKSAWQRLATAVDQCHCSGLRRRANRRDTRGLLGESPRERRQQGFDNGRSVLRKILVAARVSTSTLVSRMAITSAVRGTSAKKPISPTNSRRGVRR